MKIAATPVIDGAAEGRVLKLSAPISFWGGVDPSSARIVLPGHPDEGASIAGKVLAVARTIGSSSSSAIMLELLRIGRAPAALILARVDAILALGVVVGIEMGYPGIPVLRCPLDGFETGMNARLHHGGAVELDGAGG